MMAMAIDSALHTIGDYFALAMLIPLIVFVVLYTRSPWRSDPIGIALMLQKIALTLLVLDLVLANYLPEGWDLAFVIARLVIFGTVLTLITIDTINLRRIQTGSKRPLFLDWLRKDYTLRARRKGFYNRP
jgi:hypothetical protein